MVILALIPLFASQWMFATMTLDEAIELYKPGKVRCRGAPKLPLKELGADPATGKNITKDGRFGMCVTDGEINASLRLRETVDFITLERGFKLLAGQRAWTAEST